MPNPKGINQYSKGGGHSKAGTPKKKRVTGTFAHGTKSANSSGGNGRSNSRADALKSARLAKKNAAKKKGK